jgi:hypothetical protein
MTNRRDFLSLMGVGLAGRSWLSAVAQNAGVNDADLVVFNAKVQTVDARMPNAEAFAVKGGRFFAVGSTADIKGLTAAGQYPERRL